MSTFQKKTVFLYYYFLRTEQSATDKGMSNLLLITHSLYYKKYEK
jgi:hypothetical protein